MIVINVQFLTLIGMPQPEADELAKQPGHDGLSISYLFSFGGNGDPRSHEEAKATGATTLTLVGMADRYGCAQQMGIAAREMCRTDFAVSRPTDDEAAALGALLDASAHPAAARIAELVRAAVA
jgi:hypothetical protein